MTSQEKNRFENKVSLAIGKNAGPIEIMVAYEIADDMNIELSKRQALNAIKKGAEIYGY